MIRRPYNQTETFDQTKRTVKAQIFRRKCCAAQARSEHSILYIYAAGGIRARSVEDSWFKSPVVI
jgi:hypothetical protein